MLAGLDTSGSTTYENVTAKLKKADVRLRTGLQGLQGQQLARLPSTRNQSSLDRNNRSKKPGHFKTECKKL